MESYLIPWIVVVIKMIIAALVICVAGALAEKYLPESIKEKIVEFIKKGEEDDDDQTINK